ncbi:MULTISPECIES: DUF664 domain-containing protein [Gordonia]|nr:MULTISPECIES: DUF664 domain-containing protein [Gordonia]AUH70195.1 DUF664 domain-containing protein [Gordonia sp. YC-JH1]KJR08500.1 hypothetical protein UG54_07505 [Gordonia sihwensis]KXT58696.1 hypothetical protein Y710_00130 [Gordonia sp. QH-12]WFN92015.1 DUF664 domain-containing protein [Gordonia sihwensis]
MYAPARDDELTGLINYADQQLGALRAAAFGLTEAQARQTPCRSVLSIGGLIKHIERGLRGAAAQLNGTAGELVLDEAALAEYMGSFALTDDETAAGIIERFDAARAEFLEAMRSSDPDGEAMAPPAPWAGVYESRPMKNRYYMCHQVEEYARHAGHADIIREQIDGMSVAALEMTLAGAPANQFFTPYTPAPGTLLA